MSASTNDSTYEWDVFVSYTRDTYCGKWARKIFKPLLESHLKDYDRRYCVFIDADNLKEEIAWPVDLANALSTSRLLVPLISAAYFQSDWCNLEFELMVEREKRLDRHLSGQPSLILPVIVHDGDELEDETQRRYAHLNPADIRELVYTTVEDSPVYCQLSQKVQEFSLRIHRALAGSPEFKPEWRKTCLEKTRQLFEQKRPRIQKKVGLF